MQELGRIRPYVDLSRVGIWGWSGGGSNTLNALFRRPDVYQVGIAVAPKPQADLYNAWFQEIYMNTQEVNQEGYDQVRNTIDLAFKMMNFVLFKSIRSGRSDQLR